MAIFIGIGANIPGPCGDPQASCEGALHRLEQRKVHVDEVSSWWKSEPVPRSHQPWYVNGVARVTTHMSPQELLIVLHKIERSLGRVRTTLNESRCIDLDLLAYNEESHAPNPHTGKDLHVPHPRLHERAFVLFPLMEICPSWTHPKLQKSVSDLLADLPETTLCQKIYPNVA